MAFCTQCGAQQSQSGAFCSGCGARRDVSDDVPCLPLEVPEAPKAAALDQPPAPLPLPDLPAVSQQAVTPGVQVVQYTVNSAPPALAAPVQTPVVVVNTTKDSVGSCADCFCLSCATFWLAEFGFLFLICNCSIVARAGSFLGYGIRQAVFLTVMVLLFVLYHSIFGTAISAGTSVSYSYGGYGYNVSANVAPLVWNWLVIVIVVAMSIFALCMLISFILALVCCLRGRRAKTTVYTTNKPVEV